MTPRCLGALFGLAVTTAMNGLDPLVDGSFDMDVLRPVARRKRLLIPDAIERFLVRLGCLGVGEST